MQAPPYNALLEVNRIHVETIFAQTSQDSVARIPLVERCRPHIQNDKYKPKFACSPLMQRNTQYPPKREEIEIVIHLPAVYIEPCFTKQHTRPGKPRY
jgi:hypothetical protein